MQVLDGDDLGTSGGRPKRKKERRKLIRHSFSTYTELDSDLVRSGEISNNSHARSHQDAGTRRHQASPWSSDYATVHLRHRGDPIRS
jgi:hypothetical protein